MIHMYAVVLAVILLVGALAAIIICVCVDIVPIIKSRGSTLVSRDSVTQEQARMLKKSLQRNKLTSSASADFVDTVQGMKPRAQALRKSERPRYGSTPLALLSGDDEKNSDVEIKTTTVIIEALPKSPLTENNNNNEADCDIKNLSPAETKELAASPETNEGQALYTSRPENVYTDNKPSKLGRSGSSPNVAGRRSNSTDLLNSDVPPDITKGAMTYNSRDPRVNIESELHPRSYPNSPNVRSPRPMAGAQGKTSKSSSPDCPEGNSVPQQSVRSKLYHRQGVSPSNCVAIPDHYGNDGEPLPQSCDSHYCKWCHIEREKGSKETRERPLPFRRTESFPETYGSNSSPRINQKHLRRQRSFEEDETAKISRGFPYDRNKFCKNPHRGYSPCPDCFHNNSRVAYYPHVYHERGSPTAMQNLGITGMGFPPKGVGPLLPGPLAPLSSSSSSSSSGSSTRFRHLRQPLEDIQEDASDCYAMRDVDITSTIDSRELDSSPDDETMPKSTDNSVMSVSPIIPSEKQQALVSASGS